MNAQRQVAASKPAVRFSDISLAGLVLLIVGMMIIPLPTWLLDILIAGNISFAVLMIVRAMYIANGLQFASFPTVLLITTLYRLALNVSSTRLILLDADAGKIIDSFGHFVVQGNYVVGAVIFLILTLIQFLVIAKGSERVAEVGARFTLDAMPGKQMSIDAELRSGALSQDQARKKREELQRESQFYGAMDGAMKFVKGDAIAGIVITVINILGGLAIGVAMRDMSANEALKTYGLLTIGDGLVSQIPALLISTSAGLVVTRVASETKDATLASDVAKQIFGQPRSLLIGASFLGLLSIVPGLPALPFVILALMFASTAARLSVQKVQPVIEPTEVPDVDAIRTPYTTKPFVPFLVPVSLELGRELGIAVSGEPGARSELDREIRLLRDALFVDIGVTMPNVRISGNDQLEPWAYRVCIQEVPVATAHIPPQSALVLASPEDIGALALDAHPATDPYTHFPASWIHRDGLPIVRNEGMQGFSASQTIARHLRAAMRQRSHELLGLQEVQAMLDHVETAYPALVRNVVPRPVGLPLLADILRRLIEEGISIRALREILEAMAIYAPNERDPVTLTELVRSSLRRQITHKYAKDGVLSVYMLDPGIEDAIRDAIQTTATGSYLAMAPDMAKDLVGRIQATCQANGDTAPILLTQADIRRYLRRLVEVEIPQSVVLSYQELAPEVTVQPVGRVSL